MLGQAAGILREEPAGRYRFVYDEDYDGPPVSLTMPVEGREFGFDRFPPFFEGLLPEGAMLEGLLRQNKLDRTDLFAQLLAVGADTVGAVTVAQEPQ
jgi:serine/threonine-protein kinase HipA